MKSVMRGISLVTAFGPTVAYAAQMNETNDMSLILWLFLALVALIIGTQVIPACVLFCKMVKRVFGANEEKAEDDEKFAGRAP
ncbi:MAG: hypothetical protein FIB02_03680 [Desulfuromonas sp.]|nr:hypothetical protein [Desulfuromonas sp.]